MNFYEWLEQRHIVLSAWQMDAAANLLSHIAEHQTDGGKTYLLKVLTEFVNTYGNNFNTNKPL